MDIFISYRRADSSAFAARLRDRLAQSFPDQVFLDVSGIDAGEDFIDRLRSAVLASKVVVAVIGLSWMARRTGQPALGDDGDVVTQEIIAALEAEIPIVPVLIDGARMPSADDLPARLQPLARRNAIAISHERFDSDATHLVAAVYRPLGLAPPNRLERMLELIGRASVTQRSRDQYALGALATTAFALLFGAEWIVISDSNPSEVLTTIGMAALALLLGILGRHSVRRHGMALASIVIAGMTLVASFGLAAWRGASLPMDHWLLAMQAAQEHADSPEFPADRISWSPRPPFDAPMLPSVECECLMAGEPLTGTLPYVEGTVFTFTNACAGPVTLVLSRSREAFLAAMPPWLAGSGRDFAVVILAPDQVLHVPMAGTFGGAYQPWVCRKEPPPSR